MVLFIELLNTILL